MSSAPFSHTSAFRARRALNWFPLGVAYAMLYMGRYNLTVAKTALGDLMTKEDFGVIFGVGTVCYALAFLLNGPLTDRIGGRRAMLIGVAGSCVMNAAMGLYLRHVLAQPNAQDAPLRTVFSLLYGVNMYFQSYGAVAIVKVNSHWFHVRERGGFSGIFGTMISSGIFLAFTVNFWLLDVGKATWTHEPSQWIVFLVPAALLAVLWLVELVWLRDRPSDAGHPDFDTGDASSGDDEKPLPTREVFRRLFTNPIILTVAGIELCTGVLRNGVMHWFPIYAKEVWALPSAHALVNGDWKFLTLALAATGGIALNAAVSRFVVGNLRRILVSTISIAALAPFFVAGWGGLLFVAGVIGGNTAGWVSDLFFQSRRAPAAFGLYFLLTLCAGAMALTLAPPTTVVASAKDGSGILKGDRVLSVAGQNVTRWEEILPIVKCIEPTCIDSTWDPAECVCSTSITGAATGIASSTGTLTLTVERAGQLTELRIPDPAAKQRAGDKRTLGARPELPMSPWALGVVVFIMSLCVIGTHGLLSGTATMDFGGRKAAATAVGMIDGAVYLGTALQSFSLGFLTTKSWAYWPWFLLPFAIIGTALLTRIWHAKPKSSAH
jgi:OPA family glycerol-3-phosphate transporter-like MFS transporter